MIYRQNISPFNHDKKKAKGLFFVVKILQAYVVKPSKQSCKNDCFCLFCCTETFWEEIALFQLCAVLLVNRADNFTILYHVKFIQMIVFTYPHLYCNDFQLSKLRFRLGLCRMKVHNILAKTYFFFYFYSLVLL